MIDASVRFVLAAVLALGLTSCGDDEGCDLNVSDICAKVMDCGGFGFDSAVECESRFIGDPTWGTECSSTSGYFDCMCDVIDAKVCKDFSDLEGDCWLDHCE